MVVRRVCVTVVTVYLAVILVTPSQMTCMMSTIFHVVFRARTFTVAAIVGHVCLPTPVRVIVANLVKLRVEIAAFMNE